MVVLNNQNHIRNLILPFVLKDVISDPGYYTITAYFDHDTLYPDHLIDYMCGT